LSSAYAVADVDGWGDRFVRGSQAVQVLDRYQAAVGQRARVEHQAVACGRDRFADGAAQVDASVAGAVRR
jgi:hypothetical protein